MNLHQELVRCQFVENQTRIKEQVGKDAQRILEEVRELKRQEAALEEKMSRVNIWSPKWWHFLKQLDVVHRDLLAGMDVMKEYREMVKEALKGSPQLRETFL